MSASSGDEQWMDEAIALARRGLGHTHPNPPVGAVVVIDNQIIGRGWHVRAGGPHAEVVAIADAKSKCSRDSENTSEYPLRGATLVVTLEPCCTHGRTPPCTEAILREGISKVIVGATDPNPLHAGRGYEILRANGVEVTHGIREPACRELIADWIKTLT